MWDTAEATVARISGRRLRHCDRRRTGQQPHQRDDDGGGDPEAFLQLLELGGNVAGYIKVDRKDNTIDHSSTDNEAFIYYVHGPADPRLNSSELLEVIPVEWKCDGAFYGAADGVWYVEAARLLHDHDR